MNIGAATSSNDATRILSAQEASKAMSGMASGKSSRGSSAAALSSTISSLIGSTESAGANTLDAISLLQTSNGYLDAVSSDVDMMAKLAVQANSGTLSADDMASVQAQFKTLQDDIKTISGGSNALAQFNGSPLLQGDSYQVQTGASQNQVQTVETRDLSDGSQESVGTVDVYSYDSNGKLVGSTHTSYSWGSILNQVDGLDPSDPESVGVLAKAADFVSSAKADNDAQLKGLVSNYNAQQTYEANLASVYSDSSDTDMALASTQLSKSMVMEQSQTAMQVQANSLGELALKLALVKR